MGTASRSKVDKFRSLFKSMAPGERLRLRDEVYKYLATREWIFKRMKTDGIIMLVHETGQFGFDVEIDDVDWEAYRRSKEKKGIEKHRIT